MEVVFSDEVLEYLRQVDCSTSVEMIEIEKMVLMIKNKKTKSLTTTKNVKVI